MTTKKTTKKTTKNDRIKETVEKAKKDLTEKKDGFDGCSNTISVSNPKSSEKPTTTQDDVFHFMWEDDTDVEVIEKFKLAKDIVIRLIDFNINQLTRKDVEKVLIYDNPAEYAAEIVNEMCKRIGM
jgi:hypothetical protein